MTATAPDDVSRVSLDAWLVTDIGMVREHNEDSAHMEPTGLLHRRDGMGGHAAGEVASAMAVETVRKTLEGARTEIDAFRRPPRIRAGAVSCSCCRTLCSRRISPSIMRGQNEPDKQGMGTTLDVCSSPSRGVVAHVAIRARTLIRDGKSSQITTDHTVAEVLVIGASSPSRRRRSPRCAPSSSTRSACLLTSASRWRTSP